MYISQCFLSTDLGVSEIMPGNNLPTFSSEILVLRWVVVMGGCGCCCKTYHWQFHWVIGRPRPIDLPCVYTHM